MWSGAPNDAHAGLIAPPKNRAYDLEETAREREQRIVDGLIEQEQRRLELKRQEENEMRAIENGQVVSLGMMKVALCSLVSLARSVGIPR